MKVLSPETICLCQQRLNEMKAPLKTHCLVVSSSFEWRRVQTNNYINNPNAQTFNYTETFLIVQKIYIFEWDGSETINQKIEKTFTVHTQQQPAKHHTIRNFLSKLISLCNRIRSCATNVWINFYGHNDLRKKIRQQYTSHRSRWRRCNETRGKRDGRLNFLVCCWNSFGWLKWNHKP